ncbi:hypothetical protein HK097_003980 [Rhizophlyctis rosea]|uniref:Uncharacterized protein n=1 Tax=Rhizophlyctis rosea TaxID=64517 RepID=A0AAD5SFQ3_9FUNG|nr:hypothetical protein HK097_003980 [Rhizophlyctis rosea]
MGSVFRKSCEVTLRVLRESRESLMSVLETFLYDPLCEWSKQEKGTRKNVAEQDNVNALKNLNNIRRKLEGYVGYVATPEKTTNFPLSVAGQVHELIEQATDPKNLSQMYVGEYLEC